jgi:hypothetical protein
MVLSAIYGPDGHDLSVKPAAFNWDASFDWKKLRVGTSRARSRRRRCRRCYGGGCDRWRQQKAERDSARLMTLKYRDGGAGGAATRWA